MKSEYVLLVAYTPPGHFMMASKDYELPEEVESFVRPTPGLVVPYVGEVFEGYRIASATLALKILPLLEDGCFEFNELGVISTPGFDLVVVQATTPNLHHVCSMGPLSRNRPMLVPSGAVGSVGSGISPVMSLIKPFVVSQFETPFTIIIGHG